MNSSDEMQARRQRIYLTLASVPKGKVVTYGQLAALSGITRGARQAGRVLRDLPEDSTLPWFRVVNSQGRISVPEPSCSRQKELLEREGVAFLNGRIKLADYRWQP